MELTISLPAGDGRLAVTGVAERNLKVIREAFGVGLVSRDGSVRVTGDGPAVGRAAQVIERLTQAAAHGEPMAQQELLEVIATAGRGSDHAAVVVANRAGDAAPRDAAPRADDGLEVYLRGRRIVPKTEGQRRYVHAIHTHDLTLCTGPAGSGKTYLAVAAAVAMLMRGTVRKLVLVRPAVEAGERLGFLPGSMQEKVNPYLRPLLDALHDMMEFDQAQRFMANDLIEIVPLAFMRGRTLNDALIILDEAQNTTRSQMLMFLTRLGHGGKMVVTGDTSQTDLADPRGSGLVDAARRLRRVGGVAMVTLAQADIVRHSLVQRIVAAYGADGAGDDADAAPRAGGDGPAGVPPDADG